MIVDPEGASGEPAANRADNNIVVPFTILPAPAANGPDLNPHDFSVTPLVATVGGTISVQGGIRNVGNAASTASKSYVSISTSATIAPDKTALNTMATIPSLGIYVDASVSSAITLPNTLPAGNYYLWIMTDPENAGGEAAENRNNNNIVLPLTITQPLQTYNIAAVASPGAFGSVAGFGSYVEGALVPLVATSAPGYSFVNWTENGTEISASPVYSFIAGANRTLAANFAGPYTLTLSSPNGALTKSPDQPSYAAGMRVSLSAVPNYGYQFVTWSGDASGNANPLAVTMNASKTIIANFIPLLYTLNTTTSNGSIIKTPDQPSYVAGSTVTLTAQPSDGYQFGGWSGDATGTVNPLAVTMDNNKSIAAIFTSLFDDALNFNNNQVPQNWNLMIMTGSPGSNAHVQNQRFEVGGQDTYAYLEATKHVPAKATKVEISYTCSLNDYSSGMATQIQLVLSNGDIWTGSFGNGASGSQIHAVFGKGAPYPIDKSFPMDFQPIPPYRLVATFWDGGVRYQATKQGSVNPLFDETVSIPGFAIHQIQNIRLFALDTSSFDPSWIDDVNIRATTPYQQWKELKFGAGYLSDPTANDGADANGNGITNFMEYALGHDPKASGFTEMPTTFIQTDTSMHAAFKYRRLVGTPNLLYTVGVSNDLVTWDWTQNQLEQIGNAVPTNDGLTEEVTVRLPAPINEIGKVFFRLKVSDAP